MLSTLTDPHHSRQSLKKFVQKNQVNPPTQKMFDALFNKALKAGVDKGVFEQPKGPSGGTKLAKKQPAVKKETAKAAAPAKKETTAAAKKPAAKKAAPKKAATATKTATKAAPAAKAPAAKKAAPKKAAPKKAVAPTKVNNPIDLVHW